MTIQSNQVLEIIQEANTATTKRKEFLRSKLHSLLEDQHTLLKNFNVLQYHFVLPNNESFYRAHKPSKFGDSLIGIRTDFEHTNKTHKPIRGFIQGVTAHGFRNVFPIFDLENNYIGAMEVSFASDSFEWYLNKISGIHSHFLVDKNVFKSKTLKKDDLILKYHQSAEHKDYMLAMNDSHTLKECIIRNGKNLEPKRDEINSKIKLKKPFSIYAGNSTVDNNINILSFLPIRNIENKVVAWIVSHEDGSLVKNAIRNAKVVRIVTFFVSLIIIYFLIREIKSRDTLKKKNIHIKEQHELLHEMLDTTDSPMFVTDLKDVKLVNNGFKSLLNLYDIDIINKTFNHNILQIFQ